MGERGIVCCRVISDSGTRWSDACVFALQMWCCGTLFHAIRCRRSGRGSDAVTSCTGVVDTVTRACGGPEQIQVYHAVWVYKEGRNSGRLMGVAMHAAAENDMRCLVHVDYNLGAFSGGRESFLIYLEVIDDASCGRHFHFIRGWHTGDKDERERRLAKRAAAGTLTRLGIVCTASCMPLTG
ncbi:hypothetical protein TcG_09833 [Trypanosoma cruzi]|nr:hypothetical protein TcG_09833 [Trypanosoma cruzi]